MILMITVLVGCIFSLIVLGSCAFMSYDRSVLPNTNSTPSVGRDGNVNIADLFETGGTIGLYKYNPDGLGCTDYDIAGHQMPASVRTSRLGGVLGAVLGFLAFFMILLEFVCCRFWCSRVLIVLSLVSAGLIQLMTFFVFSSQACLPLENFGYRCGLDAGAIWSLVASGVFLLAAFLTCPTPKVSNTMQRIELRERSAMTLPLTHYTTFYDAFIIRQPHLCKS
jgi:hypothetical protein